MTVKRLLLARHGETGHNNDHRFTGWADPPLTRHGRAQARALGRRLRDQHIDAVYCSDLSRTIETARIALGERADLEPAADAGLREANFGAWQGLTFNEARELYPDEAAALLARSIDFCAPGGETIPEVHARVCAFLDRIRERHEAERVLVVASGGPIQILIAHLFSLPIESHWRLGVNNCALSIVDFVRDEPILTLLNDRSHLARLQQQRRRDAPAAATAGPR
jgi:broad specificity phosphatase PhoE